MEAPADTSGSKNMVQARGSTITYLERYTLCAILGIATADEDMDGRLIGELITPAQAEALTARLEATGSNTKAFCKMLGIATIEAMPAAKYSQADKELSRKELASKPAPEAASA